MFGRAADNLFFFFFFFFIFAFLCLDPRRTLERDAQLFKSNLTLDRVPPRLTRSDGTSGHFHLIHLYCVDTWKKSIDKRSAEIATMKSGESDQRQAKAKDNKANWPMNVEKKINELSIVVREREREKEQGLMR